MMEEIARNFVESKYRDKVVDKVLLNSIKIKNI